VGGQLGVRPVDLRVIQVRAVDAGLEVVGHEPGRAATEELQRSDMRRGPAALIHPQHRPDEHVSA